MPYLHWETSHKLARMTDIIREVTKEENKGVSKPHPIAGGQTPEGKFFDAATVTKLRHKYKRLREPSIKHLGPYLMSVANMFDAMDHEPDETLLREGLHNNPPLHVRRTLDQTYFSAFDDTGSRSKDQVVYRGTRGLLNNPRVLMVDQLWMWILDESKLHLGFQW